MGGGNRGDRSSYAATRPGNDRLYAQDKPRGLASYNVTEERCEKCGKELKPTRKSKPVALPKFLTKKIAETLLPVVKQAAETLFPPLAPLIEGAYGLYLIYQNRKLITTVAKKINDGEIDDLAHLAAEKIATKGVEVIAEGAANTIADKSAEKLKDAGFFDKAPGVEAYYKEYAAEELTELIEKHGENFVEHLR